MKILILLLIPFCAFSQSDELSKKFLNSYGNQFHKVKDTAQLKEIIEGYKCLNEKYDFDIKNSVDFLTKKQFIKKYPKTKKKDEILKTSILYFLTQNKGEDILERFKKCATLKPNE